MNFDTLHGDLLRYILTYLKPRDIVLLKFVCRHFGRLIQSPRQVKYIRYDTDLLDPHVTYHDLVTADHYVDDIRLFRWAVQNKCPFGPSIMAAAIVHNNREIIEYIHEIKIASRRCIMDTWICAYYGHLELLQWMVGQDHSNMGYMGYAAAGNRRDILEWGLSRGELLDRYVCAGTMISGSIEILEWVLQHNKKTIHQLVSSFHLRTFAITAAQHRHFPMLEWLY